MQILLFLHVGDRTQQKTEALSVALQELSDHLFGTGKEAPDFQVNVTILTRISCPRTFKTVKPETTTRCHRMISTPFRLIHRRVQSADLMG